MFRLVASRRYIIPGALLGGLLAGVVLLLTRRKPLPVPIPVPVAVLPDTLPPQPVEIPVRTAPSVTITMSRAWVGRLCGIGAIIAFALSGWGFRWVQGQGFEIPYAGWNGMLVGALLLGCSIYLLKPQVEMLNVREDVKIDAQPYRLGWRSTLVGAVLLIALALVNGHPDLRFQPFSQHLQMALFLGGVGAVTWGLGGFRRSDLRIPRHFDRPLLLILALALGLRLWMLGDTVHIMIDELHFTQGVVDLRNIPDMRILNPLNNIAQFTYIYSYFQNGLMALFKDDFYVGMRFLSVIFGTLTVAAIYGLGRALFDRKTALLAALVLALFPAHIHFSRLALNNIADPLFGTLAVAGLAWGMRTRSPRAYALAGVCLGLTSYFYEGGRLLFLGLLFGWLGLTIFVNRFRFHLQGVILFLLAAFLVVFPYYYAANMRTESGTPRFDMEGVRLFYLREDIKTKGLIEPLRKHWEDAQSAAIYHTIYTPDGSAFYYGGYTAIVPWYVVPFYLLGLFYLLWRGRAVGAMFWLWLTGGLVGIGLIVSTDWTVRFAALFPAMAAIIAVGLRYPLEMLWPSWIERRWLLRAVVFIIAVTGFAQLWHYFGDHMLVYNRQLRSGLHDFAAVQERAIELAPNALLVYLTDEYVFTPVTDNYVSLRAPEMDYYQWTYDEATRERMIELPLDRPLAFAILPMPAYRDKIRQLRELFPLDGPYFSSYPSIPEDRQYELYMYFPS